MKNTIWVDRHSGAIRIIIGWNTRQRKILLDADTYTIKLTIRKGADMYAAMLAYYAPVGELNPPQSER